MNEKDKIRLMQMRDAAREAVFFIQRKNRSDLDNDRLLELSLVRLLEMIGEAATKLSSETTALYPDFPHRQMIAMRNRLIHGYDSVALDIVWETVKSDLPNLLLQLDKILN
jgi:uncharacterized protein with HEPN domain